MHSCLWLKFVEHELCVVSTENCLCRVQRPTFLRWIAGNVNIYFNTLSIANNIILIVPEKTQLDIATWLMMLLDQCACYFLNFRAAHHKTIHNKHRWGIFYLIVFYDVRILFLPRLYDYKCRFLCHIIFMT